MNRSSSAAAPGTSESTAFYINANDVTIDGFTVQGQTSVTNRGAGIVIAPGKAGTHIVNNIIQNNVTGLYLANSSSTDAALIQHNVFLNNNNDGDNGGRGIYTDAGVAGGKLTNVTIDGNTFFKDFGGVGTTTVEAAISFESNTAGSQSNIRITNNVMDSDGKAVLMWNASNVTISGNYITFARDEGSGALRFEGGDSAITIQGNEIYDNPGTAIRIDNKATDGDNKTFTITGNNIYNNGLDPGETGGLAVGAGQYQGALNATDNWWGNATGPSGDGTGTGDPVQANGTSVTFTGWATVPVFNEEAPYWGTPSVDGAPIQAEDFDHGGLNVAYKDDPDNDGGRYRPYENVDIEGTTDTTGAYDVFSTDPGEYMAYTVDISKTGDYEFDFRVANGQSTLGTFHIEVDGVNVSGPIAVPDTGSTHTWETFAKTGVQLPAGVHVMKLVMDTGGNGGEIGDFNYFQFTYSGAPTVPAAPTNLIATTVSTTQIDLVWTNTATNQTGFNIDRSTDGVNFTPLATNVVSTSYVDSNLTPGQTYYYQVRATNLVGDSADSNIASAATLPATDTPTNLSDLSWASATAGFGTVQKNTTINGNPITLDGAVYTTGLGTHAVSNIVYNLNGAYNTFVSDVGVDDEENGKGIGSVDFQVLGDGKVLFDSGILNNGNPAVHVAVSVVGVNQLTLVATNGVTGSIDFDHADWAGAQLLAAPAVPATPTNLTATALSTTQIALAWTNNANNQTGFNIDRSTDGVTFTPLVKNFAGTTFTDTNLTPGTQYYYVVRATNLIGDSLNSNVATATTLSATDVGTYLSDLPWVSATAGYGTVQLDKTINGNPITLGGVVYPKGIGTHASSTIIYNLNGQYDTFLSDVGVDDEENGKGTGSVDFQVIGDGKVLFDSGILHNGGPATHIDVSVAGVKQLELLATNGVAGSIDYDHSDWAGAEVFGAPALPAAPSNLTAEPISGSQINLTWQNNASNNTGIEIDRSTDGVTFSPLTTLGPGATSFSDMTALGSTKYYYEVLATNGAGKSTPSNIANATTYPTGESLVYLSDIPWVSATAGFGTVQLDQTIKDNPITLRGTTYAKGIGTHAASTITYNLAGQYETFTSDIGIDDEVNGLGSVDFQIIGDGKVLFDSGTITGSSPVVHVNISVAGVQQLQLVVTNTVPGSIDYDHADWAGASLLTAPPV